MVFLLRQRTSRAADHTGLVVDGFTAERMVASDGRNARWEIRHVCGEARIVLASTLTDAKRGKHKLECAYCMGVNGVTFRAEATQEHFALNPTDLCMLIGVMASERARGRGAARKELNELCCNHVAATKIMRSRWVTDEGGLLVATAKAWRELGFKKEERAA